MQPLILASSGLYVGRQAHMIPETSSARDHEAAVTFHQVTSFDGVSHCSLKIDIAIVLIALVRHERVRRLNVQKAECEYTRK